MRSQRLHLPESLSSRSHLTLEIRQPLQASLAGPTATAVCAAELVAAPAPAWGASERAARSAATSKSVFGTASGHAGLVRVPESSLDAPSRLGIATAATARAGRPGGSFSWHMRASAAVSDVGAGLDSGSGSLARSWRTFGPRREISRAAWGRPRLEGPVGKHRKPRRLQRLHSLASLCSRSHLTLESRQPLQASLAGLGAHSGTTTGVGESSGGDGGS
mmetsp:Transcript_11051/g.32732  ORF Transcript_11051/g.32732 Transcript_11051/m.32732 type:complete len:219 (-) Transcript_11051:101-757(-)